MNYYDEEIIVAGADTKNLSATKVDRLTSGNSGSRQLGITERETMHSSLAGAGAVASARRDSAMRTRNVPQSQSTDDDGLLQEIIDHDDEDDTEEDSELQQLPVSNVAQQSRRSASQRPTSSRFGKMPTANKMHEKSDSDNSSTDTEEAGLAATITADAISSVGATALGFMHQQQKTTAARIPSAHKARSLGSANATAQFNKSSMPKDEAGTILLNITPDKWEQLNVDEEVKEIFPSILKYTPQHIEVPYRLQPFIPEFVPAVGDVDAFLKVTTPPVLQTQRQREIDEHVRKMGLYFLDEPSGEQSQPSLLNMKLRSVLTGSGVNPRSASAALIPVAKSNKDIDKWIGEVEQIHIQQSVHVQHEPRKEMEALLLDWPRQYAGPSTTAAIQDAYQRCLNADITLAEYVRILSERFEIEGPLDTQADYILNVQTLFALYLAANQAWE